MLLWSGVGGQLSQPFSADSSQPSCCCGQGLVVSYHTILSRSSQPSCCCGQGVGGQLLVVSYCLIICCGQGLVVSYYLIMLVVNTARVL